MLWWTEASVSRNNCFATATRQHASWASPSTRLQLMDRDAQLVDPGKNGLGDPGLMAPEDLGAVAAPPETSLLEALLPTISAPTTPCGTSSMLGTSAVDATTGRRRATGANKVRFLSSAQHFLQNPGTQNTKNRDRRHTRTS
jgi:hypothetical protein